MHLTDDSLMPFGKYRNSAMEDVPAGYLLWLWNDGLSAQCSQMTRQGDVARYIKENMDALQSQAPDIIVNDE